MRETNSLLDQLSQVAREGAQDETSLFDERWDRLSAGALSETEHDELLGLADASGKDYEAYQAFKPLGPAFQQNVAAAILASQTVPERVAEPILETPPVPARRKLFFGAFASAASLVLGALLVFPTTDPLSTFTGERTKGAHTLRGNGPVGEDFDGIPRFHDTNVVDLIFKASVAPGPDLEARLYTFGADGRLQLTSLQPAIENDGRTVQFDPILGRDLVLSPGAWKLVAVLSRPGKAPDEAAILEAVKSNGKGDTYWQVLVTPIEVEKDE